MFGQDGQDGVSFPTYNNSQTKKHPDSVLPLLPQILPMDMIAHNDVKYSKNTYVKDLVQHSQHCSIIQKYIQFFLVDDIIDKIYK